MTSSDSPRKWSGGAFSPSRDDRVKKHRGGDKAIIKTEGKNETKGPDTVSFTIESDSAYVARGGDLHLSNLGQLELLRATMERGVPLRTTVRGFSMRPFIRDQDVLTIAPLKNREPRPGDVVAFTQSETGRLAIHRIIGRTDAGWLIRGDNSPEADGVVGSGNIIGLVIRIEREGKDVRLGLGRGGSWIAALNRGHGLKMLKKLWNLPRRMARFAFRSLETLSVYRSLGRRLAPQIVTSVADENDLEAVHDMLNPSIPYRKQPPNPDVVNWIARRRGKIVGFVQYVFHPESHYPWVGHWLFSLHIRRPLRGLGIGEKLSDRVIEEAKSRGAAELLLAVYEDNTPAIRLYEKMGFAHVTLPALEPSLSEEKEKTGRRRIVMKKH